MKQEEFFPSIPSSVDLGVRPYKYSQMETYVSKELGKP